MRKLFNERVIIIHHGKLIIKIRVDRYAYRYRYRPIYRLSVIGSDTVWKPIPIFLHFSVIEKNMHLEDQQKINRVIMSPISGQIHSVFHFSPSCSILKIEEAFNNYMKDTRIEQTSDPFKYWREKQQSIQIFMRLRRNA